MFKRRKKSNDFSWNRLRFWKSDDWTIIQEFLKDKKEQGFNIYPSKSKIFRALDLTPFNRVKIVILGQDPYYQKGLADGLAFSVLPNVSEVVPNEPGNQKIDGKFIRPWKTNEASTYRFKLPGSLTNIIKEYREDLGFPHPRSGDLSTWARNGILLLNTVWTVEEGRPQSHHTIQGSRRWQQLSAEVINELSMKKDKLVYILWGSRAREWRYLIDEKKHLVLTGPHPSPRNYTNPYANGLRFAGGRYFSKACEYLGINKSIWRLP